jgi:hypothetical protein
MILTDKTQIAIRIADVFPMYTVLVIILS